VKQLRRLIAVMCLVQMSALAQGTKLEILSTFKLPGVSVRAIEVIEGQTLWFAGSAGRYGRVTGDKIEVDSISLDGRYPAFRSIGFNGSHVFLLSIESPALLYKIDPSKPLGDYELVYREDHPRAFYDSLTFFDEDNGIAMGDPTENCLSILTTSDGGNHWTKLPCSELPETVEGEAAFAASNSNIATFEKNAWIATGGTKARIFRSPDLGHSWQVSETPIVQGGKMTGIFSTDFFDNKNGMIMGGNWEDKKNTEATKAITRDGGVTWNLISANQLPGFISCIQYRPGGAGKQIMAVSSEGIYYTQDEGTSWIKVEDLGFYSLRFIDEYHAWLSTHEEIVKIKVNL